MKEKDFLSKEIYFITEVMISSFLTLIFCGLLLLIGFFMCSKCTWLSSAVLYCKAGNWGRCRMRGTFVMGKAAHS